MMNERRALFRQLTHYFRTELFGLYSWADVTTRPPEPVSIERDMQGRRINERSLGRMIEKAEIEFDGYTLQLFSPNEIEPRVEPGRERPPPAPAVVLYDGGTGKEYLVVEGANTQATWSAITKVLRENMAKGQINGEKRRSSG